MQALRRACFVAWASVPWLIWQAAQALGRPIASWHLPGRPHPVGLFILAAAVWELMLLAPWLELRGLPSSWRHELAQWALYVLFAATISSLFVGWAWAALLLSRLALAWLPWLAGLGAPLYLAFFLALVALTGWALFQMEEHHILAAVRRFLRHRLLGLRTDNATLLALLRPLPLPAQAKAAYQRRLETGWVSRAMLEEMLQAVEALPPAQTTAARVARLRFIQALRNRLDEAAPS